MRKSFILACALVSFSCAIFAQVSMTVSGSYIPDFNSLPNTGNIAGWTDNVTLSNWYADRQNTPPLDSIRIGQGSSNKAGFYSFGTGTAIDRAMGSVASGTFGTIAYGILLQNNSGVAINNVTITYTGEQWRNGGKITTDTLKCF
jgi:hypothetical protein